MAQESRRGGEESRKKSRVLLSGPQVRDRMHEGLTGV